MLGFEAKGRAITIGLPSYERIGSLHKVTTIELDTGLVGVNGQSDATEVASGDGGGCAPFKGDGRAFDYVKHKIVVVTVAEFDLLVCAIVDAGADGGGLTEIEGCAADGIYLTGGDQRGIDGGVIAGVYLEGMVVDGAAALAVQVEIRVIGEVQNGGFVGAGVILDAQPVPADAIGDGDLEVAGVAFFAVFG